MEKKPMYVAFSTQKGGAGKTTLTVLVASYLHYVKGYNVAVVDCDYPQYSVVDMRKRDRELVMDDEYYSYLFYEQATRLDKKIYPVEQGMPENAIEVAQGLSKNEDFDFIFFDLPGTINNEGVVKTLSQMDYIFSPISADYMVLRSTLRFADVLNEKLITTGIANIKGLYLLWNLVDGREKSELYEVYEKVIEDLHLTALKTFLPDSKRFRKELSVSHKAVFRSTLFPVDKALIKGSNLDLLVAEILELLK
ncbi:conjugal transfer protein TraA [Bacteroidia bacterium]|nr:conjugal transfer protein TraA [Bacteroidia bacterium]